MLYVVGVLFLFVVIALATTLLRAPAADADDDAGSIEERFARSPLARSAALAPWLVGLGTLGLLLFLTGLALWIATAIAVVAGVLAGILASFLVARRTSRLEFQLADAIDLIVSALRAGGSLTDALSSAARETRRPLRSILQEFQDRMRLGERPVHVLSQLERRVPLESFRLFSLTLSAHWEGGGSLATTLSNVGRTIRDRVDVSRRIRSQAVETQVSVVGVLVVTYGLAWLMWTNYPDRFTDFATSEIGSMFIGLSIVLQGVGLFWISRMTRIEV